MKTTIKQLKQVIKEAAKPTAYEVFYGSGASTHFSSRARVREFVRELQSPRSIRGFVLQPAKRIRVKVYFSDGSSQWLPLAQL